MSGKPKILIVDDEPRMCDSLEKLLSGNDYEIHTSYDGREATELLSRINFDIVLLDIVMPGMDGFQVMEYIEDQGLNTAVILMTGNASIESAVEALKKGAYDYLKKPFEHEELLITIKNTLDRKGLESNLNLAKKDLKESEEKYQRLFNTVSDAIMVFDGVSRKFVDVNDAATNLYGYTREEFLNLNHADITMEEKESVESIEQTLNGKLTRIPLRYHRKRDGTVFPAEISSSAFSLAGRKILCGVVREITERKQAEEAMRESEERLSTVLENLPGGVFAHDLDGRLLFVNETACKNTGYSQEELLNMSVADIDPSSVTRNDRSRLWHSLSLGESITIESTHIRKDGSQYPVEIHLNAVTMNGKRIILPIAFDFTDRKRAEENLEKEFHMRTTLLDNIPGCIALILKKDTHEIVASNRLAREVGAVPGQTCFKTCAMRDDNCPFCLAPKLWTTGQLQRLEVEYRGTWYEGIWAPLSEDLYVHYIFDITERKKMEEVLLKSNKLESLGTLAGGIAHDFNNLLSIIMVNISMAEEDIKSKTGSLKFLKAAEEASNRAKDLTARLITFSKGGKPVKRVVSIENFLKDSVSASLSGSDIDCKFSIPDDLSSVNIDQGQMKQAIYNMVINAHEAMAGEGTIKVDCENVTIGENDALTLKRGKYVKISITDQGTGIPEENLSKIFDPYFSTKEMGEVKGMGLGLSSCHSIVENHNGLITVESEMGVGTTLSIYLPASDKEVVEPEPVRQPIREKSVTGKGKVLLMDDEKMIRDYAVPVLSQLGYMAEVSKDGAEAIDLYKKSMESKEPFDVVILDLTCQSGMGGKEAIEKLLEIDPNVKAIVSTGYSGDPVMTNFLEYGFSGALAKPYTIGALSRAIKDVFFQE